MFLRQSLYVTMPKRLLFIIVSFLFLGKSSGDIQFDFFPGYRENIVQGVTVPLAFEIFSEDIPIKGEILIRRSKNSRPIMEVPVEIAAGTRKRVSFPLHVPSNNTLNSLVAELRYNQGKDVEIRENYSLRVHQRPTGIFLSVTERPVRGLKIPEPLAPDPSKLNINNFRFSNHYGSMVHLRPEEFPDQVGLISGVFGIFLDAEILTGFSEAQIRALITWVENGGNLALSVSQAAELTQVNLIKSWLGVQSSRQSSSLNLKSFCQFYFDEYKNLDRFNSLIPGFGETDASIPVVGYSFSTQHQSILDEISQVPIVHRLSKGLGKVSIFPFDLKNSGLTEWDGLPWIWIQEFNTQMVAQYALDFKAKRVTSAFNQNAQWNFNALSDNYFGQIVNSSQIKKIPVFLLMAMLIIYLIIIGPADWIFLKRINRPMLTWITFPSAVIIFSLLIYYMGYTVRSGRTEWSAVHLVKMPAPNSGGKAVCRTYAGIYSPSNREYPVSVATRSGVVSSVGGAGQQPLIKLDPSSGSFSTELSVPVWVSEQFRFDYEMTQSAASGVDVQWENLNSDEAQIVVSVPSDFPADRFYLVRDGFVSSVARGRSDVLRIPISSRSNLQSNKYTRMMSSGQRFLNDHINNARNNRPNRRLQSKSELGDPQEWNVDDDHFLTVSTFSLVEFLKRSNVASSVARSRSKVYPNYYSDSFLLPLGDLKEKIILLAIIDDYQNPSIQLGYNPAIRKEKGIFRWVINEPTHSN